MFSLSAPDNKFIKFSISISVLQNLGVCIMTELCIEFNILHLFIENKDDKIQCSASLT